MVASYLKRFYLDDAKLAQRALLEFHRALASGRMIAFTGAMTTQSRGYGDWNAFVRFYIDQAIEIATGKSDAQAQKAILSTQENKPFHTLDLLRNCISATPATGGRSDIDIRVIFGLAEEALDQIDQEPSRGSRSNQPYKPSTPSNPSLIARKTGTPLMDAWPLPKIASRLIDLEHRAALYFRVSRNPEITAQSAVQSIVADLGITRFATLNYDLELETVLALSDCAVERGSETGCAYAVLKALERQGEVAWDAKSHLVNRLLPGGQVVQSDILHRERIDRMIEFALGGDDVDFHVMHLHGRCCTPKTMIVSYRDYDRLYRRQDLHKLPFEYGQRLLMGGNPILFVGLGMAEHEVNKGLEDFISNSPFKRVAPTFLLWNGDLTTEARERKRADWLHRLGVLAIFDTDVLETEDSNPSDRRPPALQPSPDDNDRKLKASLERLAKLIAAVPAEARTIAEREEHIDTRWRSMERRIQRDIDQPLAIWSVEQMGDHAGDTGPLASHRPRIIQALGECDPVAVIAPAGSGKGSLAHSIAFDTTALLPARWPLARRMLINGSFCFDTDSMLDLIARFVGKVTGRDFGARKQSRRQFFADEKAFLFNGPGRPLIIINGMERFFDTRGRPISSELDELFATLKGRASPLAIQWLFFGTVRVQAYLKERLGLDGGTMWTPPTHRPPAPGQSLVTPSVYLQSIEAAYEAQYDSQNIPKAAMTRLDLAKHDYFAQSAGRISGDIDNVRRVFFDTYLTLPPFTGGAGRAKLEVLRLLAFIGTPVEINVLCHAPRLAELIVPGTGAALLRKRHKRISDIIRELRTSKFVIPVRGFSDYGCSRTGKPPTRYTLHRSLLTELRFRFGVPLSEAKLSTAFNMSLYVAQPVDSAIPETAIHDELGALIDRLTGSYMDAPETCPERLRDPLQKKMRAHAPENEVDRLYTLCLPRSAQALRAALAVLRGYYTTTGLLTLDTNDRLLGDDRDAVLLEHAERMDALIDGYGKLARARAAVRSALGDEKFERRFGTGEPFYPDELVWLHNERGVVQLIMGNLYEAKRSFNLAMRINREHVEFDDRGHNWRRIRLNQLTVDLEQAEFSLAERKIQELIAISREGTRREDELALAIATGYQGWVWHLRGDVARARIAYCDAIKMLGNAEEARAVAYFQRLKSMLGSGVRPTTPPSDTDSAIDLAESTRQMDIAHRTRIVKADTILAHSGSTAAERRAATHMLEDALHYSLQTNTHRVRIEACAVIARVRLQSGDFDGALRHAIDALMIATRYGIETRKITLRTLIGRIMGHSGHPITGSALISTAIKAATRRRYQTAIDAAEEALLDIPTPPQQDMISA